MANGATGETPQASNLDERLEILDRKIDKLVFTETKTGPDEKKTWWLTATQFLALPAILILMLMQFSQAAVNVGIPEKTNAEIEKIRAETENARLATRIALNKLEEEARGGAPKSEILESVAELRQRVERVDSETGATARTRILETFILLWIIYNLVSLALEILGQAWSTMLNAATGLFFAYLRKNRPRDNGKRRRQRERLQRWLPFLLPFIAPLFNVFAWSVRLAIFVTLVIPLFDLIMRANGSEVSFAQISDPLLHGDIGEFLVRAKRAIYS